MLPTDSCSGCMACAAACPKDCLQFQMNRDGFFYPLIDKKQCINCLKCEHVCPILVPKDAESEVLPIAMASYAKNEEIRRSSSSGGVFSVLAEAVLNRGGVVCGAAFDHDLSVHHIIVSNTHELAKLRGSKYVQSNIEFCFRETKKLLQAGKVVLFSGTPCQIEGLLAYLEHPYQNLITIDIICHGVPSDRVWKEYLRWNERRKGAKTIGANFRDKSSGWMQFSLALEFENGTTNCATLNDDSYMRAFLKNICLRKSCYQCRFKSTHHRSDLTIGDFWGVKDIAPVFSDDKGVSLILAHSDQGSKLVRDCSNELILKSVNAQAAIAHNGAMTQSVWMHPFRGYFFQKVGKKDFKRLVESCLHPSYLVRLERKLFGMK